MSEGYIRTATLKDGRRLELDEEVPLRDSQVKVTIEPLSRPPKRPVAEVLAEIYEGQRRRGHVPRTRDEIDREIEEERKSWD